MVLRTARGCNWGDMTDGGEFVISGPVTVTNSAIVDATPRGARASQCGSTQQAASHIMSYAFLALHGRAVRRESSRDHTRDAACVVVHRRVRSDAGRLPCLRASLRASCLSTSQGRAASSCAHLRVRARAFSTIAVCLQRAPTRWVRSYACAPTRWVRSNACAHTGAQGRCSLCLAACGVVQRCASCGLACLARYRSVWCNTSHVAHEPLNLDDDHSTCACVSAGTCTASRTRCPT